MVVISALEVHRDMSFSIDARARLTGETVIVFRGELVAAFADRLVAVVDDVLRGRPSQVCLDLGLVTFADSGGVGAVLQIHRHCSRVSCHLIVEQVSPVLERALATAGVLEMLRGLR